MTRTEIEVQALSLSEQERAALASQLVASLEDPRQLGTLAPEVFDAYKAKMDAWGKRLEGEAESWFDPSLERIELTEAVWNEITSDEWTEEELNQPLGMSVPPKWTGRPLRELVEATKKTQS
jgi:hypothetical protein